MFKNGKGTIEVVGLIWCEFDEVVNYITSGKVADGLTASFPYIERFFGRNMV